MITKKNQYIVFLCGLFSLIIIYTSYELIDITVQDRVYSSSSAKAGSKGRKERAEYFHRLLADPKTNEIPINIRTKEIEFAERLNKEREVLNKHTLSVRTNWIEAGPNDVGGRTRALAVDVNNSNIIIAGGASGGIWKSTDNGVSWNMKSTNTQVLSVTCIAQDKREGHTNNWYYAAGEFRGSAEDQGFTGRFSGAGVYKSTDNGESWNILPNTYDTDKTKWDSDFDFVENIIVSPITGSIFITSQSTGVLRSTDGGNTFNLVLGGTNEHIFSNIDISANGNIAAVLSSPFQGVTATNNPGIYLSTNDGNNWTNITPNTFPSECQRSIVKIAPSNNNIIYVLTFTGSFINEKYDDIRFHWINLEDNTFEDRSANMPNFGQDFDDYLNTQNNYNMVMAVKPNDENFVLIGATSLFRSTDGFSTALDDVKNDWIGGYHLQNFFYPNFHPDIHSYSFDPNNPNAVWWGHDGGLSYTSNITNISYTEYFPWENKNNGYNVTQFYMVSLPDETNDTRIMGGTQDNGSPYFRFDGINTTASEDISTGDGSYAYWGDDFAYTSAQNGAVLRIDYDEAGNPSRNNAWSNITPQNAQNQLFINPYVVDPSNENYMFYPAGNVLWRNNSLKTLPYNNTFANGIEDGWVNLDGAAPEGYVISALSISKNEPSSRLYYSAVDFSQSQGVPKLYRMDNAQTGIQVNDISVNSFQSGMYIHNIAINPNDGDELLVIVSNYNVVGIYHSNDAGVSFTGVEGNLEGTENNPGPSIRGASILPYGGTTTYYVGTSTGIYSTTNLNGNQTEWQQEGPEEIGNVIVNYIDSRISDGRIIAGTHGRGIFVSDSGPMNSAKPVTDVEVLTLQSKPGESGSTKFVLSNEGQSELNYNVTVTGDLSMNNSQSNNILLKKSKANINLFNKFNKIQIEKAKYIKGVRADYIEEKRIEYPPGNDVILLDDGDGTADDFIGWGDGSDFYWYNEFNLSGFDFQLDEVAFFMRTEYAYSNTIFLAVYDAEGNILSDGTINFNTSVDGTWFTATLNPVLNFNDGDKFIIEIETKGSYIGYPAGVDVDANVKDKSFYYDGSSWVNLNTISGYENGAFLIRAVGTLGSTVTNQNPTAVADVTPTSANINETITFDASNSTDNDGQIVQYLWNFGDGTTSSQKIAQHSYSQHNTYNYTLTVTDDKGATGSATGKIEISEPASTRVTVEPASGKINPGGSQEITLTLNAVDVNEGTYVGQVKIVTNVGNIIIPIDYTVNIEKSELTPLEYTLGTNYPNPFNPYTTIVYELPVASYVKLEIYDLLGEKVATLENGLKSIGRHKVLFNASILSSGVYFYRIDAKSISSKSKFHSVKKLILLK